jgi:hypothetical protein
LLEALPASYRRSGLCTTLCQRPFKESLATKVFPDTLVDRVSIMLQRK